MAAPHSHPVDTEFQKLVRREPTVDLTTVALELARDLSPDLEFAAVRGWIAERVRELAGPMARSQTERDALEHLGRHLTTEHGLCVAIGGSVSAETGSLNHVIETGRGTSICLSLIAMAVAGPLGLELRGVNTPTRCLTRLEVAEGPLFLDLFSGSRVCTMAECLERLRRDSALPAESLSAALKPSSPRAIVIRMLNDRKAAHMRAAHWQAAWKTQQRLAVLQPASFTVRRDLAVLLLRVDRPGQAVDLLRSCLRVCPSAEQPALRRQLAEARNGLSRWN